MKKLHYIHIEATLPCLALHKTINKLSIENLHKIKIDLLDAQRLVRTTLANKIKK